jgi:hypothetical protein
MRRWAPLLVVVLLALVAAPIFWIEGLCAAPRDPLVRAPTPLVNDRGYTRRESDSYLSFPEWHIVYAHEDLAGVLRRGDESDFAYGRQILAFWRSLCGLTRVVTSRSEMGLGTKVMLYWVGWNFTADLALKGAYEKTIGRAFEWLRGADKTAEDQFAARDMQAYAAFLRQTPWYDYPFGARLAAFWRETPLGGTGLPRKLERRVVFTLEYGAKAVYGALVGFTSDPALGATSLEIHTVVVGLEAGDAARDRRITIVRDLGGGRTLIRTPRHRVYTDLMIDLARRGRDIAEIAGNHRILVTVLAPKGPLPELPGATALFEVAIQSVPQRRRVGLDVSVDRLAATIRALDRGGASVEHLYDY